ncbi:hypothetical protein EV363DRAFT_858646 [Boletus edulis]|nr:hypothetical protein EV363DRAFT_858646 [Boletus edulis]
MSFLLALVLGRCFLQGRILGLVDAFTLVRMLHLFHWTRWPLSLVSLVKHYTIPFIYINSTLFFMLLFLPSFLFVHGSVTPIVRPSRSHSLHLSISLSRETHPYELLNADLTQRTFLRLFYFMTSVLDDGPLLDAPFLLFSQHLSSSTLHISRFLTARIQELV